ncbi:MAG: hypothetical protein ACI4O7_09180 [Aristaeellaceae bacterium]
MKLIRYRKPSLKTALGITRAKRRLAKATGIPTTRAGRKRKALNALTGGSYGKYQRMRANLTRPYRTLKRPPSCMGLLISVMAAALLAGLLLQLLLC